MSTIRLLKDDPRGKKGEIVSVPFGVGQSLVAKGTGEYPPAAAALPAPPRRVATPTDAERHAAEIARLNERCAAVVGEIKADAEERLKVAREAHEAELAKLRAELDAAQKTVTELQAKAKK